MPRWLQIQTLHYRRYSLRSIARQLDLSRSQVHRVVAGRRWREDGDDDDDGGTGRTPSGLVVNHARGTPQAWVRVLALNEIYRSRCLGDGKLLKRLTARQGAYLEGVVKNRGPDYAGAAVEATERYVMSLADLDVAAAVQRVNQDSGHRPAYRGSTYGQRRLLFSTVCEEGVS